MASNARFRITAEDNTERAISSARRNFTQLSAAVAGVAASIGLSVAGLAAFAKASLDLAIEHGKLASQLGLTTQGLRALSYAFVQDGVVTVENFTDAIEEMMIKMGEAAATGEGPLIEALDGLGLSIKDIQNLDTPDTLLKIADAFEKIEDRSKAIHLGDALFGGEGAKFVDTLREGSEGITDLATEFTKFAGVISDEQEQQIKEYKEQLSKLDAALEGLGTTLAALVAGPGGQFIEFVAKAVAGLNNWHNTSEKMRISEEILRIGEEQEKLINSLKKMDSKGFSVIKWFGTSKTRSEINADLKENRKLLDELTESLDKLETIDPFARKGGNDKKGGKKGNNLTEVPDASKPTLSADAWLNDGYDAHVMDHQSALDIKKALFDAELESITDYSKPTLSADAWLNDGYDAHVMDHQSALDIKKALFDAELESITDYWDRFNNSSQDASDRFMETWGSTIDTFSSGVGGAVADAIVDQTSLGDALQATMRMVAKQVISSLIQIGVQRAIQAAMAQGQQTALTGVGLAQAKALTAAYGPAAVAANIATAGGASISAAAAAPAAGAAMVAAMQMASLSGVAHDGLDSVPQDGTYLLQKGERVVKKKDNEALSKMLGGNMTLNLTVNAVDTEGAFEFVAKNIEMIGSQMQQLWDRAGRTGGPMR